MKELHPGRGKKLQNYPVNAPWSPYLFRLFDAKRCMYIGGRGSINVWVKINE